MRRILTYGGYFEAFVETLEEEVERKIDYGLQLLKRRKDYQQKLLSTLETASNDNVVVLFNGFQKKSQKTPQNEIKKAQRIKKEYYGTQKR